MCDPIVDDSITSDYELEPFKKEIVEEYLRSKNSFDKHPLRHYSQQELTFDEDIVKKSLDKLDIPIVNTRVTVFGGYTGQFADCLRSIGMQVIFTDPLEEWVKKAIDSGFQAYKYTAEEIPKDLVKKTDLFATFECYLPFVDSRRSIYTTLRFLTSKFGILFTESKRTTDEIKEKEGTKAGLKFSFLPYSETYSIKRVFREKEGLRLYHFCSDESTRAKIKLDCEVSKLIYDNFPNRTHLDNKALISLIDKARLNKEELLCSLKRILNLYQLEIPRAFRIYIPDNVFVIFSKRFYINSIRH